MSEQEVVRRVSEINLTLRRKHFSIEEINEFWDRFFLNVPKIEEVGVDNIKVCTGCGHLNIEEIKAPAHACCPDSNYIPIKH